METDNRRAIDMGQRLLGNVVEVPLRDLEEQLRPLLIEGENMEVGYKGVRDLVVLTDKRIILQDIQGISGKKQETYSVPWKTINTFSVETPGKLDLNAEMVINVRGESPRKIPFARTDVDHVHALQRRIATHVIGGR